jgi:ankyrin repeat protein
MSILVASSLAAMLCGCLQGFENHSRFDKLMPGVLIDAYQGDIGNVRKYIELGGDVNVTDNMGNTALMRAALGDRSKVVEYLLREGADSKRRNKAGETALDIAKRGAPKRATRLLEAAKH